MKDLIPIMGVYGAFDRDVTIVKKIGDRYKVCNLVAVRKSGIEFSRKKTDKSKEKLDEAISRARTKIREYIECNDFTHFVTLTINKEKYDRYDLQTYYKDFAKWINNKNRTYSDENKIKYIFVPEMHDDGAWHLHGVMMGGYENEITKNENGYMDWEPYKHKFGFISLDKIRCKNACAKYVSKYITKSMQSDTTTLGANLYYCSHGLRKPEVLFRGTARLKDGVKWDFITDDDFCRLKNFYNYEDINTNLEILVDTRRYEV